MPLASNSSLIPRLMASHHIKIDPSPLVPAASLTVNFCNDKLIFFGGFNGTEYVSGLKVLNIRENRWEEVTELNSEKRPSERHLHCAEFIEPSYLVVFGGARGAEFFDDTFLLNTADNYRWESVEKKEGRNPEARYGAAMCKGTADAVYLIAGYGGSSTSEQPLDDLWIFEASKRAWRALATFGDTKPSGTGWHCFLHLSMIWAVGEIPNKFLVLDLQSREWRERTAIGTHPNQLSKYSLTQLENNVVVVFGGVAGM